MRGSTVGQTAAALATADRSAHAPHRTWTLLWVLPAWLAGWLDRGAKVATQSGGPEHQSGLLVRSLIGTVNHDRHTTSSGAEHQPTDSLNQRLALDAVTSLT